MAEWAVVDKNQPQEDGKAAALWDSVELFFECRVSVSVVDKEAPVGEPVVYD